jgi:hypothetical protein
MVHIDQIHEAFATDCVIDQTNFVKEYARFVALQPKYLDWYSEAKRSLIAANRKMKVLKLDVFKKYDEEPAKEDVPKEIRITGQWNPKTILKSNIPMYMDADEDLNQLQTQIDLLENRVNVLDSMRKTIQYMSNILNAMREERNYRDGG